MYSESEIKLFTEDGNIKRYMDSDIVDQFEEGQMATTTFPNGYGHGPRTHNESIALNTIDKPSVKHNLRIRKLTPKECFRLMGVKDEDYDKVAKNQSDASLYHLAGDSIVVNVLMAIFKQLF
jgi:DNA (cytosine-5)-methyltransferase 1